MTFDENVALSPNLLVVPRGELLEFRVLRRGNVGPPFLLPNGAVDFLLRFARRRRLKQVLKHLVDDQRRDLYRAIEEGFLIRVGGNDGGSYSESREWIGFRLIDLKYLRAVCGKPRIIKRMVGGRTAIVADNVLSGAARAAVYRWFSQLNFSRTDSDTRASAHHRHWIRRFVPVDQHAEFVPFMRVLDSWIRSLVPSSLELNRLHAYSVSHEDVLLRHRDLMRGRGITAVFHANYEWHDDWMGEMIFYRNDETDAAIQPRPGRLIVFPSELPHRAGCPSRVCDDPRYTLVFRYTTDRPVDLGTSA